MNILFRNLFKILRYLEVWAELDLGIEHIARLGYVMLHALQFIFVRYIDIDFIQREPNGVNAVEFVFSLVPDRLFQCVHCLRPIDLDVEWCNMAKNEAIKRVRHLSGFGGDQGG